MNTDPYYQPLTNDYNTPLNNSTPYNSNQNQPSIQVNQSCNNNGSNIVYKSPCNAGIVMMGICSIFVLLFGGSIIFMMLYQGIKIYFCLIPLIFFLIGLAMLIFGNMGSSISIEPYFGTIIITKKKFLFCFNRKKIIQFNEIQQVIVESYMSHGEEDDYPYFRVKFKLKDGKEIEACSDSNDHGEGRKAFEAIKNALPQNIPFGGDLAS